MQAAAKMMPRVTITGELDPFCRFMYYQRLKKYDGDWTRVVQDVRVKRLILSEKDRIGIGTFQPKDEKNQDATELTGDINYRKIAEYGSDSDPRAFNFDGEFNIANRGIIEFVEVLKLDVAFLYDLLGASQEHKIKPKKFAQTDIDEVILGHTNEPEYRRLQNNEFMEALRDRTVKIDVPYVTTLADEIKIYEKDYNKRDGPRQAHRAAHDRDGGDVGGAHAARRAEARRPDAAAKAEALQRQDAARLHRGQHQGAARAGRSARACIGISPRYVQDKISNALVAHPDAKSINPFMVLNELEAGLKHHSLITNEEIEAGVPRAARRRQGRVREHREERSAAGDRGRRGRAQAAVRQLHRQRQGLHAAGKGPEPLHRQERRAGRAADAVDRGEDRHSGEPQGRLPPRDHELHRRPVDRRQDVRLQDERAAVQGAGAEAVRGSEGLDQADEPGVERRRCRHAGRRSTS